MSKCKHAKGMKEPWDNIIGLTVTYADGTMELVGYERCWKCGETLSIGPANESDERVQVEILAAWLLESHGFVSLAHKDDHHLDARYDDFREDCAACQALHLAQVLAWHDCSPEAARDRLKRQP